MVYVKEEKKKNETELANNQKAQKWRLRRATVAIRYKQKKQHPLLPTNKFFKNKESLIKINYFSSICSFSCDVCQNKFIYQIKCKLNTTFKQNERAMLRPQQHHFSQFLVVCLFLQHLFFVHLVCWLCILVSVFDVFALHQSTYLQCE